LVVALGVDGWCERIWYTAWSGDVVFAVLAGVKSLSRENVRGIIAFAVSFCLSVGVLSNHTRLAVADTVGPEGSFVSGDSHFTDLFFAL
jgi:hypothetical protein